MTSVKHLRVFCSEVVGRNKAGFKKFKPKEEVYKMVGNSLTSQAYRIVVEKRDVLYVERNFDDTSAETTNVHSFVCAMSLIVKIS